MKGKSRIFTPIPSAARTATITHDLEGIPGEWDEVVGYLIVGTVSGTSPTLDVAYETSPDGGATYFTHSSFTQVTASTQQERVVFTAPAGVEGRLNCVIGGTTPSFEFEVHLECKRNS